MVIDIYEYKAKVLDVYDGDTMTVNIDLGFDISIKKKVRLLGLDAPEIKTKDKSEKKLAIEIRDFLREMLLGKEVVVITEKPDKYGRSLCVMKHGGTIVNQLLIELNYARPYYGEKRKAWFRGDD